MYAVSHGNFNSRYALEVYEDTAAGLQAARDAVTAYTTGPNPLGTPDQIYQSRDSASNSPGVWIRGDWIAQQQLGTHSLAVQLGCNTFSANTAFVNDAHKTRNFVGFSSLCPIDSNPTVYHQVASAIFDNMSGIANTTGKYGNARLIDAFAKAQVAFPRTELKGESRDPLPAKMRLYNAPRLIFADIRQDTAGDGSYSNIVYSYQYPENTGTDYPGTAITSGYVTSGPIRITLHFSESMKTDWADFLVRFKYSDGSTEGVTGSWGTDVLTNDKWTGTITLSSPPQGETSIEVRARKVACGGDDDDDNQGLDLIGTGNSSLMAIDSSIRFKISSEAPDITDPPTRNGGQTSGGSFDNDQCWIPSAQDLGSGICKVWVNSGSTVTFPADTSNAYFVGEFCRSSAGSYTVYAQSCAGLQNSRTYTVSDVPIGMTIEGMGLTNTTSVNMSQINSENSGLGIFIDGANCSDFTATANGTTLSCSGPGANFSATVPPPGKGFGWSITRTAAGSVNLNTTVTASLNPSSFAQISKTPQTFASGSSVSGSVGFSGSPIVYYTDTVHGSTLTVQSPFVDVYFTTTSALSPQQELSRRQRVLRLSGERVYRVFASSGDAVFSSTMTIDLAYADVTADTATLKIYEFRGGRWDSSYVTQQTSTRSGTNVQAIGWSTHTGTYAAFYAGQDSSAPVTTFSIQGTSRTFDTTLLISTDSTIILTATDPLIDGYASLVATTVYRLNGSLGGTFVVYASSLSVPPGAHILEYYSYDWAGNTETIRTATFTTTEGSVFRNRSDHFVAGTLLVGSSTSGAKTDIESRADNDWALMLSSANRQTMASISNRGRLGIAVPSSIGRFDLGQSQLAQLLRSGNENSTDTPHQIAFGFNGDASMRHAIRTAHSTSTDGNQLDYMLWSPAEGSTATIAANKVLSLQAITTGSGGSLHVLPVAEPDAEVEVSNGASTGGGTIQRLAVTTPSSRRFKSDISYLDARRQDRALEDIAGMRHVQFRYKGRGSVQQPLLTGLVYEEAPESIRAAEKTISSVERMAQVEMALKAALKKVEALEARYKALKERGGTP